MESGLGLADMHKHFSEDMHGGFLDTAVMHINLSVNMLVGFFDSAVMHASLAVDMRTNHWATFSQLHFCHRLDLNRTLKCTPSTL